MSLQIWLPLNGNLNNYGSYQGTITNTGATVNSAGKIGSCYYFDGSDDSILVPFNDYVTTEWSFCCWFYKDSLGEAYDTIFGGPSGFEIESRLNSTTTQVIEAHSWGGGQIPYEFNKWYHLAVTRNSSNTKWYLDGELKFTGSAGSMPSGNYYIGAWRSASEQNFKGKLNDVRIYNHCLSYSEVKEISQALVLHFPLNQCNRNKNLVSGFDAGGHTAISGNTVTIYQQDSVTDTYFNIKLNEALVADTTYTLSCKVKNMNCNADWYFPLFSQGNPISKNLIIYKDKTFTSVSFSLPSGNTYVGATSIFMDDTSRPSTNPNDFVLYDFKLEKGSVATPWCPPIDNNRRDLIEVDCSGYGRNGAVTEGVSVLAETPRNDLATYFTAGSGIFAQLGITFSQFTVAFWAKHTAPDRMVFGSNVSTSSCNTAWYWYGDNSFKFPLGEYYYQHNAGSSSSLLNKWTYYVAVYDGSKLTVYRNNTNEGSQAFSGSCTLDYVSVGHGYTSSTYWENSTMSDFRIYATALSADDVAHLYKNFGSVDKNRNLFCYELKENSENIFKSEYIQKYASSLDGSYGQWGTRNSVPCMLIQPHKFWYGESDERSITVLKDYFNPNTQYVFDMWMDADDVYYSNISSNVPGGIIINYTDGTRDASSLVVTGNKNSPIGFQHRTVTTPVGKSIKGLSIYYYVSDTVYYKVGSFIAPVSQASLGTNGVFNTAQIVEVDGIASINKGGSSYMNSIIEI